MKTFDELYDKLTEIEVKRAQKQARAQARQASRNNEIRAYKIVNKAPRSNTKLVLKRMECKKLDPDTAYELLTGVISVGDLSMRAYYVRVCEWQYDKTSVEKAFIYFGDLLVATAHIAHLKKILKSNIRQYL